ncbi:MAG TPA: O-antigen ligase family protein, partial [Bacteroidia bacterium]
LWTENKDEGGFDLQVKLSLFLFPLIFGSSIHFSNLKSIKKILTAFIGGCFLAGLICFSHATYTWFAKHEDNFIYTQLSIFLHPSYFAMYISLAIAILFSFRSANKSITGNTTADFILILLFWFSIIMLQSKAGIIITTLLFVLFLFRSFFSRNTLLPAISLLILAGGIYFLTSKYIITYGYSRINIAEHTITETKRDTSSKESNQVRILIWKASVNSIKENLLIGVGTGDVKDELMKVYKEKGMTGALEHSLNAHNQYIQTFIALGIPGIAGLLLLFAAGAWKGFKQKKWLYLYFLLILFLNFIPESMLEVQAGTMFYAFFNSLFLFSEEYFI